MSELYQRFLDSMVIDFYKWHDGVGYDLEALRELPPAEHAAAETLLIKRGCQDWRDVEALAVLGTEAAIAALKEALKSPRYEVRITAAERLAESGHLTPQDVERILVETIPHVTISNGLSLTFHLAERYPTMAVRRAVLKNAMYGKNDARVHAAALAEYLYGVSKSSFDFDHQPFYLRFRENNPALRQEAYLELCQRVKEDPV